MIGSFHLFDHCQALTTKVKIIFLLILNTFVPKVENWGYGGGGGWFSVADGKTQESSALSLAAWRKEIISLLYSTCAGDIC